MIKVYNRDFSSPGGLFTSSLDQTTEGEEGPSMAITSVGGNILYKGRGNLLFNNPVTKLKDEKHVKRLGLICAGTGITPMYQII